MPDTPHSRAGWKAGIVAMLAMSAVMLASRVIFGVSTLPEIFSDTVLYLTPAPIFAALLEILRFAGKPFLLLILFLGQVAVGALVGRFVGGSGVGGSQPFADVFPRVLKRALWTCAVIWFVTIAFLMPALGVGFLGALTVAGTLATGVVYFVSYLTYGLCFAGVYARLIQPGKQVALGPVEGRRATLRHIGLIIGGVAGFGAILAALDAVGRSVETTRPPAKLPSPITPVGGFYVVNKDLVGVTVDRSRWSLTVVGSDTRGTSFSLEDLKAMPSVDLTSTLTCISNEIGGNLIGTARWTGVRLTDLLRLVTIDQRAYAVVVSAWDNYSDSIPIANALDPRVLLVYEIDGKPLPDLHGFPLRLIVPGLYGIKNVKWVKQVEVINHGFAGYWQERGWTNDATVQTQSQIDVPYDRGIFPSGPVSVGGIAFAGSRGISKVELSPDGGATWLTTTLRPALSSLTWVTWTTLWKPTTPGWHRLTVRATDGLGQPQRADITPPIPDGATGYHSISVRVG